MIKMFFSHYVILVKDSKHQSGEFRRIALWKELLVDPDESLKIQNIQVISKFTRNK